MELLKLYDEHIEEMARKLRLRRRDTEEETPEQIARRLERNTKIKQLRLEKRLKKRELEKLKTGEEVLPPPTIPDPETPAGKKEEKIKKNEPLPKDKEEICDVIAADLYYFLNKKNLESKIYISKDNKNVTKEFKNLGVWGGSIGFEDDYDEEDEDDYIDDEEIEVWGPGEYEKYLKLFKEFAKNKKWENQTKLILNIGNNKMCYFTIHLN